MQIDLSPFVNAGIAGMVLVAMPFRRDILLLSVTETPNFVGLNVLAW